MGVRVTWLYFLRGLRFRFPGFGADVPWGMGVSMVLSDWGVVNDGMIATTVLLQPGVDFSGQGPR